MDITVLRMRGYFRSQEFRVGSQVVGSSYLLKNKIMGHHKNLLAYQKAYALAIKIYHISKRFPAEERFSLTDQIRRSSRSVCTNLAEAYKRRRYKDYFISKLNDSETENIETEVWLDFAKDCSYIEAVEYQDLIALNTEVGKLVWYMINNPDKFM